MAGKIRRIWEAIGACSKVNNEPLTIGQMVAWINEKFPNNDFNPITLKAQIYRSCANVRSAQEYNAPKVLTYDKANRKYSRVEDGLQESSIEEGDFSITEELDASQLDDRREDQSDLLVGVEAQLRDYLAKNLGKLEKGLTFWTDSPPSVEYVIDGRRIDILAKDVNQIPVVVELKRGRAYDRVVGQGLLYQALVHRRFKTDRVRVILVASEITDELRLACSKQQDFKLFEYELTMQLNPISAEISEEEEA